MKTRLLHKIHSRHYFTSRLVVAYFNYSIFICKRFSNNYCSSSLIVALSIYAILSDVFDGIIARHLKISTIEMRQLDTKIDTVFWFSCLFYICITHSSIFKITFTTNRCFSFFRIIYHCLWIFKVSRTHFLSHYFI
jgi:phosphatidylglycerophosphate synthase